MESLRYRQRVEHLEKELRELQESLNAEREKVQVCMKCSQSPLLEVQYFHVTSELLCKNSLLTLALSRQHHSISLKPHEEKYVD